MNLTNWKRGLIAVLVYLALWWLAAYVFVQYPHGIMSCFALVRVSYRGEKKNGEVIEIEKSSDLAPKIEEIKGRTEAIAISVYPCSQKIMLQSAWVASPYTEQVPEVV